MSQLKRQRRLGLGHYELVIAMPEPAAQRLAGSTTYRKVLRPTARAVYHALRRQPRPAGASSRPVFTSLVAPTADTADREAVRITQEIAGLEWYHTIDLGHGVATPGFVDHRTQMGHYQLPDSLAGLRCLDVATFDGYWAFEMERRGAAEVIATDVARGQDCDLPEVIREEARNHPELKVMGAGFRVATRILGSRVRHEICSVYDLTPERFGKFDLVFLSDLLVHLRNPQLALERVASVCRGQLVVSDVFDPSLEAYGERCLSRFIPWLPSWTWWMPNVNTLKKMMLVAGFHPVEEISRFPLSAPGAPGVIHKVTLRGTIAERHPWQAMIDPRAAAAEPDPDPTLRLGTVEVTIHGLGRGKRLLKKILRDPVPAMDWYHTLDLGQGIASPGSVDHRAHVDEFGLPPSLAGLRCLDVATFDDYWAFEMERRGAAEVVATDVELGTDVDNPLLFRANAAARDEQRRTGRGFELAGAAVGSGVERVACNVYDLSPDRVGSFDLVFLGDLLQHLRDPQKALERVFSVCRGRLILADAYSPDLDEVGEQCLAEFTPRERIGSDTWWLLGSRTIRRMLAVAGFEPIRELNRFVIELPSGPVHRVVFEATRPEVPSLLRIERSLQVR